MSRCCALTFTGTKMKLMSTGIKIALNMFYPTDKPRTFPLPLNKRNQIQAQKNSIVKILILLHE